ncbi:cold shock domain-containing protein [Streptomyces sp. NPDC000410]|uniref:cold-shock protein n=1 Tax=Streptomyces sp. NPDC000410 TaxID=3154254 RepID=UPI003333C173
MLKTGKILRFDEVRGYGFILPDEGGEDVFMHANDLLDEKYLYKEGSKVEFFAEAGEKGPKASGIRLVYQPSPHRLASPSSAAAANGAAADRSDGERTESAQDQLSAARFSRELTESLLAEAATLTATQIKQVRACVLDIARSRGWVTD